MRKSVANAESFWQDMSGSIHFNITRYENQIALTILCDVIPDWMSLLQQL